MEYNFFFKSAEYKIKAWIFRYFVIPGLKMNEWMNDVFINVW